MTRSDSELANAFPTAVRGDALFALSKLPEPRFPFHPQFSVRVAGEVVSIPTRVYYEQTMVEMLPLSPLQKELLDCLLTRHHNGFVRQVHLERIIHSENVWIPPFVIQLLGEYVIEIFRIIDNNLGNLSVSIYEPFVRFNPQFIALTERRVMSYWNEYYRRYDRAEYLGFRLLRFFKSLAQNGRSA
jgi:hypothetical protein